jgi:hypothetical protein
MKELKSFSITKLPIARRNNKAGLIVESQALYEAKGNENDSR